MENKPQVGFFWYSPKEDRLFGVHTIEPGPLELGTLNKYHGETWDRLEDKAGISCQTEAPRGRVWYWERGKEFSVTVGAWMDEYPHVFGMIKEAFQLQGQKVHLLYEEHWDIVGKNRPIMYVIEERYPQGGTEDIISFIALSRNYHLTGRDYGRVGEWKDERYTLIGFNPYKPRNSFRLRRLSDGVICVCDRSTVKEMFRI